MDLQDMELNLGVRKELCTINGNKRPAIDLKNGKKFVIGTHNEDALKNMLNKKANKQQCL